MEHKEYQNKNKKEKQFRAEKTKLEDVIKNIDDEMIKNISKRKKIVKYIKECREKNVEEHEDDEDKVAEYFDHERFVIEEAYKNVDKRLNELTVLRECPYFGKVVFYDNEIDDEQIIYVGRFGLTPEENYDPVVIDWRSPVASLFYAGKLGSAAYNAPLGSIPVDILSKRQFIIKKGVLKGMFDSEMDVKDEILQMVLSSNAGEKLKDIIMTIQSEQDAIIRQPKDTTVVVNGVAGSGKTTVALHRVAYLLYNYRDTLQDKVLILGPNSIFMDYISMVLPSLGEQGVNQTTFADFAMSILGIDSIMNLKDYMEKIINNDEKFISQLMHKNSMKYIDELDKTVDEMNKSYFKIQEVKFFDKVIVDFKEIYKMFNEYFTDLPLFRRSKKVKRILFSKIQDERNERVREIQLEFKNSIKNMSKEEREACENQLDFRRRLKIRKIIEEVMRVKKNLSSWIDNPDITYVYRKYMNIGNDILTYDDLSPILYLKIKLEGYKTQKQIKHVVIDEAQDLSYLQLYVIREITKCQSMTVVGDANQRIIPLEGTLPMMKLDEILPSKNIKHFDLLKSYRSTKEIMNYANSYLKEKHDVPFVRDGLEVSEEIVNDIHELTDKIINKLDSIKEKGYESIGIICRNMEETNYIGSFLAKKRYIRVIDNEDVKYKSGEVVIPSYYAKGMEFDAVIIIDTHVHRTKNDDNIMYVMTTRALHELYIYKCDDLHK